MNEAFFTTCHMPVILLQSYYKHQSMIILLIGLTIIIAVTYVIAALLAKTILYRPLITLVQIEVCIVGCLLYLVLFVVIEVFDLFIKEKPSSPKGYGRWM